VSRQSGKPTPVGSGACPDGQITVTSLAGGAGAGNAFQMLGFVNSGKTSCTMRGYPKVVALNANGDRVDVAKQAPLSGYSGQVGATDPSVVILAPGQMAAAEVTGIDIPPATATVCPHPYPKLSVMPPGSSQAVVLTAGAGPIAGEFPACEGLTVLPIIAGATAEQILGPPTTSKTFPPGVPDPEVAKSHFPATTVS
jgi:hypothetical protein